MSVSPVLRQSVSVSASSSHLNHTPSSISDSKGLLWMGVGSRVLMVLVLLIPLWVCAGIMEMVP